MRKKTPSGMGYLNGAMVRQAMCAYMAAHEDELFVSIGTFVDSTTSNH